MDREEMKQPADDALENSLRQLKPRARSIDRDRLMFLAGREARDERRVTRGMRSAHWLWPVATFASSGIAACFAIALALQMAQPPRERIVVREVIVQPRPVTVVAQIPAAPVAVATPQPLNTSLGISLPAGSLLQMRNVALRFGVDALPTDRAASTSTATAPSPIGPWQQLRDADKDSL